MSIDAYGPRQSQDIAVGAASVACTNPIGAGVRMVRLVTTTACYVNIGTTPVAIKADPNSFRLAPNYPEVFRISPGEKVAAIQDAAGGTLTLTELG